MKMLLFAAFIYVVSKSSIATADVGFVPEDYENICRGAIGVEFFKPIKIIKLRKSAPRYSEANPLVSVYYVRVEDGTQWDYDCKFEGDRIFWRSATNNNGAPGRWRDILKDKYGYEADAVIRFEVKQNKIVITSSQSDEKIIVNKKL